MYARLYLDVMVMMKITFYYSKCLFFCFDQRNCYENCVWINFWLVWIVFEMFYSNRIRLCGGWGDWRIKCNKLLGVRVAIEGFFGGKQPAEFTAKFSPMTMKERRHLADNLSGLGVCCRLGLGDEARQGNRTPYGRAHRRGKSER